MAVSLRRCMIVWSCMNGRMAPGMQKSLKVKVYDGRDNQIKASSNPRMTFKMVDVVDLVKLMDLKGVTLRVWFFGWLVENCRIRSSSSYCVGEINSVYLPERFTFRHSQSL